MTTYQQRNLLWPVMVIGTGLLMLLVALNVLPDGVADLIKRAWPLWLVIAGFNMLLMDRIRFGNWIALVVSVIGLGGLIVFAYSVQANRVKTDYVENLAPIPLGEHIQGVNIQIDIQAATVSLRPIDGGVRGISALFQGSEESRVSLVAQENENGLVDFRVLETRPNQIPNLGKFGRGHLEVWLPVGVPITELNLENSSGGIRADFRTVDVANFNLSNDFGDIDIYLSDHSSRTIGDLTLKNGNLRIIIDPQIPLQISGGPNEVTLDRNAYVSDQGNIETRGGLTDFDYNLRLEVGGSLTIIAPFEEEAEGN